MNTSPGPWCWKYSADNRYIEIYSRDHIRLAMVKHSPDAYIMAAAPKLLAALEELLYARTDKAEALAHEAIALAIGCRAPNPATPDQKQ